MGMQIAILSCLVVFFVLTSTVLATDRLVPSVYPTIQAGINAAVAGDTVIIAQGTYTGTGNKNLDFGGKAITVRSTDPNNPAVVEATIIDCSHSGRGFKFHSGEDANSVVDGLTIKRGYIKGMPGQAGEGGGIYCYPASPTIKNCIITDNVAEGGDGIWDPFFDPIAGPGYGGGILCEDNTKIINCIIRDNEAYQGSGSWGAGIGGGIWYGDSTEIINCIVSDNSAWGAYAWGGGIYASGGEELLTTA